MPASDYLAVWAVFRKGGGAMTASWEGEGYRRSAAFVALMVWVFATALVIGRLVGPSSDGAEDPLPRPGQPSTSVPDKDKDKDKNDGSGHRHAAPGSSAVRFPFPV